jgi:7-dehydrocholesterol reductase
VLYPGLSSHIYEQFPEILGVCNYVALALCAWLLYRGPQSDKPLLYDFYRGRELHPRILNCDVKQLTICRFGMMAWQLLCIVFYVVEYQRIGFSPGSTVTLSLQTIYLAKFFYWETGYFNTLDITYDRAGYYLCWGCLVWVEITYTFHSYHMVRFPSEMSTITALLTFVVGLLCVALNYRVDYEKQLFAAWWQQRLKGKTDACRLWGKPVTYVEATYKDVKGNTRKSALLTSGFWGIARHDNYTFELACAFCWCLPAAIGHGLFPALLYFFFLTGLLVHRIYRDEDKCQQKYGVYWDKYCKVVPYRLIPYVY